LLLYGKYKILRRYVDADAAKDRFGDAHDPPPGTPLQGVSSRDCLRIVIFTVITGAGKSHYLCKTIGGGGVTSYGWGTRSLRYCSISSVSGRFSLQAVDSGFGCSRNEFLVISGLNYNFQICCFGDFIFSSIFTVSVFDDSIENWLSKEIIQRSTTKVVFPDVVSLIFQVLRELGNMLKLLQSRMKRYYHTIGSSGLAQCSVLLEFLSEFAIWFSPFLDNCNSNTNIENNLVVPFTISYHWSSFFRRHINHFSGSTRIDRANLKITNKEQNGTIWQFQYCWILSEGLSTFKCFFPSLQFDFSKIALATLRVKNIIISGTIYNYQSTYLNLMKFYKRIEKQNNNVLLKTDAMYGRWTNKTGTLKI
jgi:hypothetical protein